MAELYQTPLYEADLVRIYKYSARKWGRAVAERTLHQIAMIEQEALHNPEYGRADTRYHSPIYRYATTRNSQTVFFHRLGPDVVMITAGYSGRAWHRIMQRIEPQIQAYINLISDD